jgi:hypothetical protein
MGLGVNDRNEMTSIHIYKFMYLSRFARWIAQSSLDWNGLPSRYVLPFMCHLTCCPCCFARWLAQSSLDWNLLKNRNGLELASQARSVGYKGRGEAAWACGRGVFVNAGGLHSNISCCSGRGCPFCVFVVMCTDKLINFL